MKRAIVAIAALVVAATLLAFPPTATDASWVDSEYSRGSFSALKVPSPVFTSCTLSPGFLGGDPVATITWTLPTGYTLAAMRMGMYNDLTMQWEDATASPQVVTTGTAPNYTTKFSGGLLSGLLGGSKTAGIRTTHSSGWASGWQSAHASMALLGINPQCAINPPPA